MNLERNEYITFFACKENDNGVMKNIRKILKKLNISLKHKTINQMITVINF